MSHSADRTEDKRQLSEGQIAAVQDLHERARGMTTLAANALRGDTTNDYVRAMAVVMPLLGHAFEVVAKLAWALHSLQSNGAMPRSTDLITEATYPDGVTPFFDQALPSGFRVRPGFRGHAVGMIVDLLIDQSQVPAAAMLKELIDMPLYRHCLDAVTAFHGFTRYALLDEFLNPDDERLQHGGEGLGPHELLAGENERRFTGIVSKIENTVSAGYGDTLRRGHVPMVEGHIRELLPTVAAAYWNLFSCLSRTLVEELSNFDSARQCALRLLDETAAQVQDWLTQGWLLPVVPRVCHDPRAYLTPMT